MKILGSGPYVGYLGFNSYTRNFFRTLSKQCELKVRNSSMSDYIRLKELTFQGNPFEGAIEEKDKTLLFFHTMHINSLENKDYPICSFRKSFEYDIDVVLNEHNHDYFFQSYSKPSVAYTMWEQTEYDPKFFLALKNFDQIWVPSKWQKQVTVDQGISEAKIKVVPGGVDIKLFFPHRLKWPDDKFRFLVFGRAEYRKSSREIILAFINLFKDNKNVELLVSIDNPFDSKIQDQLKKFCDKYSNIKNLGFLDREKYIQHMKAGHVFLSCSRSEGWNLPLIEAMACGTPSIYSNCSAQLEFAQGLGTPVDIVGEEKTTIGNYYTPDYEDLEKKMLYVYNHYSECKNKALEDSETIRTNFSWEESAKKAHVFLKELYKEKIRQKEFEIDFSFNEGCQVKIKSKMKGQCAVNIINKIGNVVLEAKQMKQGNVSLYSDHFIDYKINVEKADGSSQTYNLNLENKKVAIICEVEDIEEAHLQHKQIKLFEKKHKCIIHIFTDRRHFFNTVKSFTDEFHASVIYNANNYFATYRLSIFKRGKVAETLGL